MTAAGGCIDLTGAEMAGECTTCESPGQRERADAWAGEDDRGGHSSDSDDDDAILSTRRVTRAASALGYTKERQDRILSTIEGSSDRALQRMLFHAGFFFELKSHQFAAVRYVMGVSSSFPPEADKPAVELFRALQELPAPQTRGGILADEMGLGKTVESLAGSFLRCHWELRKHKVSGRGMRNPTTIIVTPNDNVSHQWEEHLIKGGVRTEDVHVWTGKGTNQAKWVVISRYQVQAEVISSLQREPFKQCELWPNLTKQVAKCLEMQRKASQGTLKGRNTFRKDSETLADAVKRCMTEALFKRDGVASLKVRPTFCTVVIDEAHFLKNPLTFWGIGASLLGCHAARVICATGTPFNNGPQDMAAMMSYVNPLAHESSLSFWKEATSENPRDTVVKKLRNWRQFEDGDPKFILRRDKTLVDLPTKTMSSQQIALPQEAYGAYNAFEASCIKLMQLLAKVLDDPAKIREKKRLATQTLSTMSIMRISLIHPILPGQGRDVTAAFSSRKPPQHLQSFWKQNCAGCVVAKGKTQGDTSPSNEDDDEETDERRDSRYMDGGTDEEDDDDYQVPRNARKGEQLRLKPLTGICVCRSCTHYACETCHQNLLSCPQCDSLKTRMTTTANSAPGQKLFCSNIYPLGPSGPSGFVASPKIQEALKFVQDLPKGDKGIIFSFFKGGLDLIEGALVEDLHIGCARFDGDVDSDMRKEELDRFKKDPLCCVLLMSVSTGGTGLNVTEANHILFLDRWFNPCVHDQAMDRAHRIGQKKDVQVRFLDAKFSIDVVMKEMNESKASNAKIVLADGSEIGSSCGGSTPCFKDLSRLLLSSLKNIRQMRMAYFGSNSPMPSAPSAGLDGANLRGGGKREAARDDLSDAKRAKGSADDGGDDLMGEKGEKMARDAQDSGTSSRAPLSTPDIITIGDSEDEQ